MNVVKRNIPNCITSLNVLAGTAAIICAASGSDPWWGLKGYQWAYIFIAIAATADFLDGFSARLFHAYSDMGKELDSLCDLVSFGVAPAMILYQTLSESGAPVWLAWCSLLIPLAGALRLAKFNVDTRQFTSFIGLPIPANAIFWIGFTAFVYDYGFPGVWLTLAVIAVESWLMVSPVKMFSLKFRNLRWKENRARYLLVVVAAILVVCMGVPGLMWLIIYYAVWGLCLGDKI